MNLLSPFWKSYQVTLTSQDRKKTNTQFFRGFTWDVIKMAVKAGEEKSKREGMFWGPTEIKRIF